MLPKDPRVYAVTKLVNSILADPSLFDKNRMIELVGGLEEGPELVRLLLCVYNHTQQTEEPVTTRTHISWGPEATLKDAIEAYLDMFEPERRKKFLESMENSEQLEFEDRHLSRQDYREAFNLKDEKK